MVLKLEPYKQVFFSSFEQFHVPTREENGDVDFIKVMERKDLSTMYWQLYDELNFTGLACVVE